MSDSIENREKTDVVVRSLRMEDLEDVVRIDSKSFGSPRRRVLPVQAREGAQRDERED